MLKDNVTIRVLPQENLRHVQTPFKPNRIFLRIEDNKAWMAHCTYLGFNREQNGHFNMILLVIV